MDLTRQSHLEPTAGGTKRKRSVVPLGSPPLRPNPPWNPKQDALSHLFESEVADDYLIPLSREAARCTIMEDEKQSELLRRKQVSNSKAENAQDKLFARLKKLGETLQRTPGVEHLPLDKSESISKIFDCVIQWWDHANAVREDTNEKASEAQRELQNKCNLLIDKDAKQNEMIASLNRELEKVKRTWKESNRKTSEAQGELQKKQNETIASLTKELQELNQSKHTWKESDRKASELHHKCNSLLANDFKQKEEIASLTKELKEANQLKDSASETERDLRNQYNTVVNTHNSLVDKYSEQKDTIASLNRELEKVDQSKRSWDESNRNALKVQRELQNKHNSLLAKDSKQTEEIASLTKELQEVNQSKRTLEESDRKASKAQRELRNQYNSLLAKYSKQKETIASLNGEITKANQSKHTWKKEAHDLREERDDMGVKIALHVQERKKARIELDELRKAHKSASDETASLLADRDRYYEEAKQTWKAEAELKQCQTDLRQTKMELESMQAEPTYLEDYREEVCKSGKLQKEKEEVEARLEELRKENQLDSHMWEQMWSATSFENENNKKQLQVEVKTSNDLQEKVNRLHGQLANQRKELSEQRNQSYHEREAFKIQIADLKEAANKSNDLQDEVENLHKQLSDRQKEFDGQRKELHHERGVLKIQTADLKEAVKMSNDLQDSVENLHKQLSDRQKELDGQRKELHHEREASENRIGKLKESYSNAQKRLKSMKEEHGSEMERQRLSYDEDKSNNEKAAIARLKTQLEQQRESLREQHDATVQNLRANSHSEKDMLLSSCKTNAAKQAEEYDRQLKEEKEKVSKLANENQDYTRRTEFYQRELRGSQKSLEEAREMLNQLCFIAVVLRKKNMASLTQREVILSKAVERAKVLEEKLTILQDELNASKLVLTTTQSTLKRKDTEAVAGSKLLKETADRLAQLDHLHSACAQNRRLQLGYFDRQTLLADFSEFTTTLAASRRFKGEVSGREVEVCLAFLQGHAEAVCLIQGVEDQRCLQILQLAMGDCCIITHCWSKWIRLGRDKPLYILVSKVDDMSWMERHLPSGPCSSEDLKALV